MKKFLYIVVIGILFLAGCANKEQKYIKLGMQEIEKGNYEAALQDFDTGISKKEDLQLAYRGKGIAYIGSKNYEAAIEQLKLSLKQAGGSVHDLELDTNYYLALAQGKKQDYKGAIGTYTNIIQYDPKAAEAYYLRGIAYLADKNYDAAAKDFDSVITIEPNQYDYYINIYVSLNSYGYTTQGEVYLNKALSISGKSAYHHLNRGILYYHLNNMDKALEELNKAKEAKNKKALFYLGKVYDQKKDYATALTCYQDYLNSDKNVDQAGEVYNAIGLCQLHAGHYQSALDSFQKGIALNQSDSMQELLFNQTVAYEKLLDFSSAKEKMASYVEAYPDDAVAAREYQFLKTR